MADSTKIEIKGLDRLREKFKDLSKIKEQLERTMYVSLLALQTTARNLVPVDTGALRRSIEPLTRINGREITGIVGVAETYGAAVEFGTKPHWVPTMALDRWAKKRGLNPYLVARAIARRGTKPQPYMVPALDKSKDEIIDNFRNTIDYLLNK